MTRADTRLRGLSPVCTCGRASETPDCRHDELPPTDRRGAVAWARMSVIASLALVFLAAGCGKTSSSRQPRRALRTPRRRHGRLVQRRASTRRSRTASPVAVRPTAPAAFVPTAFVATPPARTPVKPATSRARRASARSFRRAARRRRRRRAPSPTSRPAGSTAPATAQGSCRQYPAGIVCKPGTCQGAAVTGAEVCDGPGELPAGPADDLRPVQLRRDGGTVLPGLPLGRGLRGGRQMRLRQLRPQAPGGRLHDRHPVCLRASAPTASAATSRAAARASAAISRRGRASAGPSRPASPTPTRSAATRAPAAAVRRACATASAAAASTRRRPSACRPCAAQPIT